MMTGQNIGNNETRAEGLRRSFNMRSLKTKGLTLLIEHGPCCIFSFVAGFMGLPFLNHNPALEFGFAMGGAVIGEYIGHRIFHKHDTHNHMAAWKRYGLSLVFGVASWGAHQALMHDSPDHHDQKPAAIIRSIDIK